MPYCLISGVGSSYRVELWQTIVIAYPKRHRLVASKYVLNERFLELISLNVIIADNSTPEDPADDASDVH